LGVIAVSAVVLLATFSTATLLKKADEYSYLGLLVASLDGHAHALNSLEWQAIAQKKLALEVSEDLQRVRTELDDALSHLLSNRLQTRPLWDVSANYDTYKKAVDEELVLIRAGLIEAATSVDEERVDPAFRALDVSIKAANAAYGAEVRRRVRLAIASSIVIMLVTIGVIQLLFGRFKRAQSASELAIAEQRLLRRTNEALQAEVAERQRAEAELTDSQERYRDLFTRANDGILLVSGDGEVVEVNDSFANMHGYSASEIVGMNMKDFLAPQSLRLAPDRARRIVTGEHLTFEIETRRKDGNALQFEVSASPISLGGETYILCFHRDISERLRAEERRRQLEAQLSQAQKLDALGTLAGGIAHDFNNMLGAIIGNTELARQDVGADHPAIESLDEIRKASLRARDLAKRILAFASHHDEPQSIIALGPVVEEAVTLLRSTLPAGVRIAAVCDADAPAVRADSTQIHQVLINLCTNSWHAMDGSSGRIDIRLDGVTLDAAAVRADSALRPGRFARLSVADDAAGMDAATMGRIFEPFFTTKPVGQGTGLGLSVVHGIIKAHGASMTVASRPGHGTTFTLYFPVAEEALQSSAASHAGPSPGAAAGGGRHVLYLDDEEALVMLVKRMLERLGYRVSGFTRGEDALAAVRADPGQFDLVVTDLNMPGISGLEVARELAQLRPDLPVVLASGFVTEELREKVIASGVRQLIYKPDTVEELCEAVQHLAAEPKRR